MVTSKKLNLYLLTGLCVSLAGTAQAQAGWWDSLSSAVTSASSRVLTRAQERPVLAACTLGAAAAVAYGGYRLYRHLKGVHDYNNYWGNVALNCRLLTNASNEDPETLKQLIAAGADPDGIVHNNYYTKTTFDGSSLKDHRAETPLIKAAGWHCLENVKALIAAEANVNIQDQAGNTALLVAIKALLRSDLAALRSDLAAFSFPHIVDAAARQALYLPIINTLIAAKANLNLQDRNDNTALMLAAQAGHTEVVTALINAKADLDLQDSNGNTALMIAVYNQQTTLAETLINAGANLDLQTEEIKESVLMIAAFRGDLPLVEQLITAGANLNLQANGGASALMIAIGRYRTEIAQRLIRAGADLNLAAGNHQTALMFAIELEQDEIVTQLIQAGANLDQTYGRDLPYDRTALNLALGQRYGALSALRLLQAGATISPAMLAEWQYRMQPFGIPVDLYTEPALLRALKSPYAHQAARLINPTSIAELLSYYSTNGIGINGLIGNVNVPEKRHTLLQLVAERATHPDVLNIIDQLLAAGADINAQDSEGLTALHHVFSAQSSKLVPCYETNNKAEVLPVYDNVTNPDGTVRREHKEDYIRGLRRDWTLIDQIVAHLITHGANIHITDNEGRTPYMYALEQCISRDSAENLPRFIQERFVAAGGLQYGEPAAATSAVATGDGGVTESKERE